MKVCFEIIIPDVVYVVGGGVGTESNALHMSKRQDSSAYSVS